MAPSNFVPPPLAPSVEEAYRRKCIQLKQRTTEVEESNAASRIRVERTMRQIEKKRIERALLLEQLQRRMSEYVEDSDGSPSPPPTLPLSPKQLPPSQLQRPPLFPQQHPLSSLQQRLLLPQQPLSNPLLLSPPRLLLTTTQHLPDDKPLRTKRGHRKASMVPTSNDAAASNPDAPEGNGENARRPSSLNATFTSQNAHSPSSDFSHTNADTQSQNMPSQTKDSRSNGNASGSSSSRTAQKAPRSAFELYCERTRPVLTEKHAEDDSIDIDEELARTWRALSSEERTDLEQEAAELSKSKDRSASARSEQDRGRAVAERAQDDEDVEMGDNDTEAAPSVTGDK